MNHLDDGFAQPPVGVTFALPDADFPEELKREVSSRLVNLPWNRYVERSQATARQALASRLQIDDSRIEFTHGADDAIRRAAVGSGARHIAYPRWGYPGYARSAQVAQAITHEYAPDADVTEIYDLVRKDIGETLVFICWPGNPIGNLKQVENIRFLASKACAVVVDLTYLNPLSREFADVLHLALGGGAHVAFSFSKTLGLASVRLGGIIYTPENQLTLCPAEYFAWNLFHSCVLDTLLEPDPVTTQLLTKYADQQREISANLATKVREAGFTILDASSVNFVSVKLSEFERRYGPSKMLGRFRSKTYREIDVLRLDACEANVLLMCKTVCGLSK